MELKWNNNPLLWSSTHELSEIVESPSFILNSHPSQHYIYSVQDKNDIVENTL